MFRDIWGEFITFVSTKGKGCEPLQESMYFWKWTGVPYRGGNRVSPMVPVGGAH